MTKSLALLSSIFFFTLATGPLPGAGQPAIVAHRGAMSERPENTMAAFERALALGADVVELDIRQSSDGKLFLLHDRSLDRTTDGSGPAAEHTFEELRALDAGSWFAPEYSGERIPSLREALEWGRERTVLLLDLKSTNRDYNEAVAAEVMAHGDPAAVVIGVRSPAQARHFRELLPDTRQLAFMRRPDLIEEFAEAGSDILRLWLRRNGWLADNPGLAERVRATGKKLMVNGTVGHLREARELTHFNPDWILIDDIAQLQESLAFIATGQRHHHETPALVVGITVDQMRYDFLYRFWDEFGDDGFLRLLGSGFSFDHARFDYAPTFTGPGHASIFTGTTPSVHGIAENRWFLRDERRQTYVTEDFSVDGVGTDGPGGQMSPRYLMTTTIGDELRLHTNLRSRVFGISLKDRGAILPAGHTGEAYWFDYDEGLIVTSTFYREELPDWARELNERDLVGEYLSRVWEPILPAESSTEGFAANEPAAAFPGQESPDFPHDLPAIAAEAGRGIVASTPFGDELVLEMARSLIQSENLGWGEASDLLTVSFSSPDHVGHQFGPASPEVRDTYLRLDRELGKFLSFLDERIGRDNYLLFLTADHGASHVPAQLRDLNIPAGYYSERATDRRLREHLTEQFGMDPVLAYRRFQVYLDREAIGDHGLSLEDVARETARFLPTLEGIAGALTAETLLNTEFTHGIRAKMQRGFNQAQSGDVMYWLDPQWMRERRSGTTHGSPYSYDTRVPLIWYGWNIPAGRTTRPAFITDIAPTLANFLNCAYPSGNTGNPLNEYLRK